MTESVASQSTDQLTESGRRVTRTYGRTHEDGLVQMREPGCVSDARELPERIRIRISANDDGCWIWQGVIDHTGYGRTSRIDDYRRKIASHRLVYEVLVGPIPEGLDLDHLCRVRACCNPSHLEAVTRQVNVLRGDTVAAANARKTECLRGHLLSGDNLYVDRRGRRRCRQCTRIHAAQQKDRFGIEEWRRRDALRAAAYYAARRDRKDAS